MSNDKDILDFPDDYQGPDQDAKEQTLLEQMFAIPAQENLNERIEAIQNAISETENALENLKDKTPKEQAHFGRRLQKLKRMLQATKNNFQNPDNQVTQVAPKDLKPVPAKVTFDDDDDAVSIPSAPAPAAWQEKNADTDGDTTATEDQIAQDASEVESQGDAQLIAADSELHSEIVSESEASTDNEKAIGHDKTNNEVIAEENTEDNHASEEDDWEGTEATLQMDAPSFAEKNDAVEGTEATLQMDAPSLDPNEKDWNGTEATLQMDVPSVSGQQKDWDGTEATLQMDAPTMSQDDGDWEGTEATLQMDVSGVAKKDEDWGGTEVTLQMDVAQNSSNNDGEWDGTEATLQNMPASGQEDWDGSEVTLQNMDSGDWDGSEATLQNMPAQQHDGDAQSTQSSTGSRTQATFVKRNEDGTPTDPTLMTDKSGRPKTKGASTKGMDAGWHLKGRKGPATGEVWGDYEIGGVLGEGGMGLVYRARQTSLNRKCAVKVLAPHLAADEKVRERFELEAQTTSLLVSPNIVNVFAAGCEGDNNYFVMEFVDGEDLSDVLKERTREGRVFSGEEATNYIVQAARGLAEAARHGIVHRDIKPGNLMVTKKHEVKIADFGIVKVMGESSLTMTGQAVGTPSYLSPEQGRGDEVDNRSDLYSLGVVFYQLITGQRPFDGSTPNALIYQHNFEEPKMPKEIIPAITDDIQAVVIKLLAKKPENRYQKAEDLIRDLEQIQEGTRLEALLAEKLSTGADEARKENLSWTQRHLLPIVGAVAALLICIGGYAWYKIDQQNQQRIEIGKKQDEISNKRKRLKDILDDSKDIPAGLADDLASFALLVNNNPSLRNEEDLKNIQRWKTKISETERLKTQLVFLDDLADGEKLLLAPRVLATTQLNELKSLIGSQSEDVIRWDGVIASTNEHISAIKNDLSTIDRTPTDKISLVERNRYQRVMDNLRPHVEDEEASDKDLERWNVALLAFDSLLDKTKETLRVIDQEDFIITEPKRLALRQELDTLTSMLGPQDVHVRTWTRALQQSADEISVLRQDLKRLSLQNKQTVTVAEEVDLNKKLKRILVLEGIDQELADNYQQRLDEDRAYRESLRDRLAVVDQVGNFDHLEPLINEFARLVGADDQDALRWKQKLEAVRDLQIKLSHLNESIPPQEQASEHLATLSTLLGEDDPQIVTWQQKLERIERNIESLKILNEVRPIPTGSKQILERLISDIGRSEAYVRKWESKINRVQALKASLTGLEHETSMPINILKQRHQEFKELVNNVGANDPDLKPWAERLAVIDGPGKPNWAYDYGRDNFGVWAELRIPRHAYQERGHNLISEGADRAASLADEADEDWVSLRFRFVPNGSFVMGASDEDVWQDSDENQIDCTLTKSFWIAETETTQEFYQAVLGTNPSRFLGLRNPVERVSYRDCQKFIKMLNSLVPTLPIRLPTEAEWERTCKAGVNDSIYAGPFGAVDYTQVDEIAWYKKNSDNSTHNVGVRQPNSLGIHDMHGNVWEWCQDGYNSYPTQDAVDFVGVGEGHVARGGSWGDPVEKIRSTNRLGLKSKMSSAYLGFRLVIDASWPQGQEPNGDLLMEQANEVLEQFKIDGKLTDKVRVYLLVEWPKEITNTKDADMIVEDNENASNPDKQTEDQVEEKPNDHPDDAQEHPIEPDVIKETEAAVDQAEASDETDLNTEGATADQEAAKIEAESDVSTTNSDVQSVPVEDPITEPNSETVP